MFKMVESSAHKELEATAKRVAELTGSTIEEARLAVKIELAKLAVAYGTLSLEQANRRLAESGVQLRRSDIALGKR